LMIVSS